MEAAAWVTKKRGQEKDDLISSLPDDILCHILSLLPTRYSVRTRVLSTRWKSLFAYVPLLDFDSSTCNENGISQRSFIDFVDRVLTMYDFRQMTKFRLKLTYSFAKMLDDDLDLIVTWILFAIRHNVRELTIYVYVNKPKTIPQELFSSETLSILKLRGDFSLKILPTSAKLPSLKTLELGFLSFDLSAQRILSISPALEDLFVCCCHFGDENLLHITKTSLRKLRIEDGGPLELVLNVPSLVYFKYFRSDIKAIRGNIVLTSLVEAVIVPSWIDDSAAFLQLLNAVSHVRHLFLCMYSIQISFKAGALYGCLKVLPRFHNLTRLEVGKVTQDVFELLPDFLNKCSILEVLVFTEESFYEELDDDDDIDMVRDIDMRCYNNVPSCVLRHLKEIEFRSFTMGDIEWKLVEYFLKNAQVLQKMKIQSILSWKEQLDLCKKLLTFSRFSRDCQIVIDVTEDSEDETE